MKKIFLLCSFFACSLLFAQTEEELFGSADDDFFFDDGIEEFVETKTTDEAVDLSKGVLFQTGSVEISGNFDLSLTTYTTFNKDLTLLLPTEVIHKTSIFVPSYIPAGIREDIARWSVKPYTIVDTKQEKSICVSDESIDNGILIFENLLYNEFIDEKDGIMKKLFYNQKLSKKNNFTIYFFGVLHKYMT